jgi:Fe-S-cluster-containing hydrogenase component 2
VNPPFPKSWPALIAERCTGCRLCELACVEDRYGPVAGGDKDHPIVLERRRLKIVAVDEEASIPFEIQVCDHCGEHPCVAVCPHYALLAHPTGRVELLEDRCTGCGKCIAVCDRSAIRRVNALDIAAKCDTCVGRDGGPACIEVCPETALFLRSDEPRANGID